MRTATAIAPAKVNLFLGVGLPLPDGYHEVTTVMHALSMHDRLELTLLERGEARMLFEPCDAAQPLRQVELSAPAGSGLVVSANTMWREGLPAVEIPGEDNLACRAVRALAAELGREKDEHVRILIEKHIPAQAGLGGGSSDAAAALVAAAELWGVSPDDPALARVARGLGADVAFFLTGGCALLTGRGDELVCALEPRRDAAVIIKPAEGVSTRAAYEAFDRRGRFPAREELAYLDAVSSAVEVPLSNNLTPAAEELLPELADIRAFCLESPGVSGALLCGSGSATVALADDLTAAGALCSAAQARGWWARSTSFSPIRAALLPSRR